MIIFKTVHLPQYNGQQLETALRKMSLKRTSPLDWISSRIDTGTNKWFLGYVGKKHLYFTPIRAFIAYLLPKFIIRLPNHNNNSGFYQIRLSFASTLAFLFFAMPWLAALIGTFNSNGTWDGFIAATILFGIYWLLFSLEFKLVTRKINKALKRYANNQS